MRPAESEPEKQAEPARGSSPTALVLTVSGAVAFAIMGDSLLYVILPLSAGDLGLLPWQLGLLLSANRLIRLFSNTWLSALFARFGPYQTFVYSAIMGVLTTAVYGLGWGFLVLLLARMAWGISWSGLRQGTFQSIWAGAGTEAGRLMGLMWGVVRSGSAISALLGGFLFGLYGFEVTVWTIAALSALAIPIALRLSWPAAASLSAANVQTDLPPGAESRLSLQLRLLRLWSRVRSNRGGQREEAAGQGAQERRQDSRSADHKMLNSWIEALSDPLQRAVLLVGFFKLLLNSILVATASLFLAERFGDSTGGMLLGMEVGALAGVVLATRWFSELFIGTAMGALSDWVGRIRLAVALIVLLCLGLSAMLSITSSLSILALLAVLLISAGVHVVLDAYANQLALVTPRPQMFVGVYATASDLGSAVGPLLALTLVTYVGYAPVYGAAALLFVLTVFNLVALDRRRATRPAPPQ
jgi:MFS family permease